jgi:tetratricopeptide (TPR) repeat protein
VNLADIYRARGRDADGERILRDGLNITPNSAMLHHSLGLALVRLKRTDAALSELKRATVLEPRNAQSGLSHSGGRQLQLAGIKLYSISFPLLRLDHRQIRHPHQQ